MKHTAYRILLLTYKLSLSWWGNSRYTNTEASCGCTTLSGMLKVYDPGESGETDVEIDTMEKKELAFLARH